MALEKESQNYSRCIMVNYSDFPIYKCTTHDIINDMCAFPNTSYPRALSIQHQTLTSIVLCTDSYLICICSMSN